MIYARVLLILIACTAVAAQTPSQLDKLRADGYDALYNLDYETARRHFQKMIELAPDNPAGPQSLAASLWIQQLNESW
jgi:Flp pilus assembly protein TadD